MSDLPTPSTLVSLAIDDPQREELDTFLQRIEQLTHHPDTFIEAIDTPVCSGQHNLNEAGYNVYSFVMLLRIDEDEHPLLLHYLVHETQLDSNVAAGLSITPMRGDHDWFLGKMLNDISIRNTPPQELITSVLALKIEGASEEAPRVGDAPL